MRVISVLLAVFGALGMASGASAQDDNKWKFDLKVDFVNLKSIGADTHVGDVVTYHESIVRKNNDAVVSYGADSKALVAALNGDQGMMWEFGVGKARAGFLARGWNYASRGSLSGEAASYMDGLNSTYVQMVRMWDQSLVPVVDMHRGADYSTVPYWGSSEFEMRKYDFLGRKALSQNLSVTGGVSVSDIHHVRVEGQTQHAYIRNADAGYTLYNDIKLEGSSSAHHRKFVGPTVGVAGQIGCRGPDPVGCFFGGWELNQSILMGRVQQWGEWIDTDNILIFAEPRAFQDYGIRSESKNLRGNYPFEDSQRRAVLNTEVRASAGIALTENVSVGGSFTVSYWGNLAMAPSWSVPGEWTGLAGSSWKENSADVALYGKSFFVKVSF